MHVALTITAKGQVTLRKKVLQHLGLGPGDRVAVTLLEPGRVTLSPVQSGSIDDLFGCLPNNGVALSVEEMNELIAAGWSRT